MADEAEKTANEQESTQQEEAQGTGEGQGKTFTQAELDRIVSERLARERKNQPDADEMKAYREWKKSQQTEAEKAAEREKALQAAEARALTLEREKAIILAGVKGEDVDYVMFKVGKLEGDFGDNLKTFLAENTKYTEPETTTVEGMKHKPPLSGGEDGVEAAFLKRNPGLKVE